MTGRWEKTRGSEPEYKQRTGFHDMDADKGRQDRHLHRQASAQR